MAWQRLRTFFHRRFAPGEYLGLHLTLGLLLSLATLGLFLFLVHGIRQDHGWLEQLDLRLAGQLEEHAGEHPALLQALRALTYAGGVLALSLLTLAASLVLLLRHRHLGAFVMLFAGIGAGLLNYGLKESIDRHRPSNPDVSVKESNPSFPSGHSMASVVVYGMVGYFLIVRRRRPWARWAVGVALALLVAGIGFSRMYLRAHYFSDVAGGFCVGTVWLAACVSGLEAVRLRSRALCEQAAPHPRTTPGREEGTWDSPAGPPERQPRYP